jgi:hypothetical protein
LDQTENISENNFESTTDLSILIIYDVILLFPYLFNLKDLAQCLVEVFDRAIDIMEFVQAE